MQKTLKLAAHSERESSAPRHASTGRMRRREYSRRRGQTLLLAVLLMVFAALLGATFITVVALNLSQTSRGTNRSDAQQAAFAGVRYANDQILSSEEGEKWNPSFDQTAPTPGAQFDAYYSAFEQAQGWTQYAKYPNPLALNSALRNSPTYLLRVTSVADGDRQGQLLIDSIGRSADDDAVFARQTAYKPTSQNGGPGAFARYDSNYDFGKGRVIQTTANVPLSGATTLDADQTFAVADASGLNRGRIVLVTVQNATLTATGTLAATVVAVGPDASTTPVLDVNQVKLRFAKPVRIGNGAVVRAASPLTGNFISGTDPRYAPNRQIDATGAGAVTNATLAGSTTTIATEQDGFGGMIINGGLAIINQISLKLRDGGTNAADTDKVQVAGLISRDDDAASNNYTATDTAKVNVVDSVTGNPVIAYDFPANGNTSDLVKDNTAAEAGDPTADTVRPLTPGRIDGPASRWLKLTRNADALGAEYGYGPGVYIDNVDDVEKVGRLIGGGTTADFRSMTVAETQRLWQRKSIPVRDTTAENGNVAASISTTVTNANVNGFYDGPAAGVNGDLHRLSWPRLGAAPQADVYTYPLPLSATPAPAAPTPFPVSLEERGIRGWVSPWEYKPRGVLIELQGNDIIIMRDDRSDAIYSNDANSDGIVDSNATVPDPNKAWKNRSGAMANNGKVYRMRLDTMTGTRYFGAPGGETVVPDAEFNGVIYAEGNVRVRGFLNSTAPDVTIASMNNIYVEGSIHRDGGGTGGHIALLAKNNVVLNPTLFLAQPPSLTDRDIANPATNSAAAYSATLAAPAGGSTTLTLTSSTLPVSLAPIRIGADVTVGLSPTTHTVLSADTTTNQIAVLPPLTAAEITTINDPMSTADQRKVRLIYEEDAKSVKGEYSRKLGTAVNAMARILSPDRPDDGNLYHFVFRHGAENKKALTLTRNASAPDGVLDIKADTDSVLTSTTSAEKTIRVGNSTYNLLQIDTTDPTALGDDTKNTFQALATRVNNQGATANPAPYDWTMTPGAGLDNVAARHTPRYNRTLNVNEQVEVPLFLSMLFNTSVGPALGQTETKVIGTDLNTVNSATTEDLTSPSPFMNNPLNLSFYQKSEIDPTEAGMFWMSQQRTAYPTSWNSSFNPIVFALPNQSFPAYFLGPMKLEAPGADFSAPTTTFANDAVKIQVDAQIYAQNGSWFVIPMPALEPAAQVGDTPDKLAASTRFRRLNYNISVQGTISQNFAPPLNDYDTEVDPDGVAVGPQQRWIDSLAYPTEVAGATDKYGTNWTTIRYIGQKLPDTNNLKMPISPDLLYVG